MKNLVLTGFMGTGKSTVGRLIAKKLGYRFIDIDSKIEKDQNMSVSEIFEKYGEEHFRQLEKDTILGVSSLKNTVIATGGGAVMQKENIKNLRSNGIIVLLKTNPDTIYQRIAASEKRPLALGKSAQQIRDQLKERERFYADNDFEYEIEGKSPMQICSDIINIYKMF